MAHVYDLVEVAAKLYLVTAAKRDYRDVILSAARPARTQVGQLRDIDVR